MPKGVPGRVEEKTLTLRLTPELVARIEAVRATIAAAGVPGVPVSKSVVVRLAIEQGLGALAARYPDKAKRKAR